MTEPSLKGPSTTLDKLARTADGALQQSAATAMTAGRRGIEGSIRFFLGAMIGALPTGAIAWLISTNPITAVLLTLLFGGASGVAWSRVSWFRARYKIYLSDQEKLNERAQLKSDAQYAAIDRARARLQQTSGPLTPAQQKTFRDLEMEVLKEHMETIGGATPAPSKASVGRGKVRRGRRPSHPALPATTEPTVKTPET
jgi:hypothetical protein